MSPLSQKISSLESKISSMKKPTITNSKKKSKDLGIKKKMIYLGTWYKPKELSNGLIFLPTFKKDVGSNAEKDGTIIWEMESVKDNGLQTKNGHYF